MRGCEADERDDDLRRPAADLRPAIARDSYSFLHPLPLATEIAATLSVALALAVLVTLISYEVVHFAELRDRMRHQLTTEATHTCTTSG